MTSKEKAEELYYKYRNIEFGKEGNVFYMISAVDTKKCALIAVDEILEHCYEVMKPFWQEVKQEIEKL